MIRPLSQWFIRIRMCQITLLDSSKLLFPCPGIIRFGAGGKRRGIVSVLWCIFTITVHKLVLVSHCPRSLFSIIIVVEEKGFFCYWKGMLIVSVFPYLYQCEANTIMNTNSMWKSWKICVFQMAKRFGHTLLICHRDHRGGVVVFIVNSQLITTIRINILSIFKLSIVLRKNLFKPLVYEVGAIIIRFIYSGTLKGLSNLSKIIQLINMWKRGPHQI